MRTALLLSVALFPALVACGAAPEKSESLGHQASAVQGGTADTKTAHNFAVGIASRLGAVCSGTLIAPNLVLTARHCVVPPEEGAVNCDAKFAANVSPSSLYVTTEPSLRGAKHLYQAKEITTPDDTSFCGNDIALITLEDNIPASEAKPATPVVQFSMADSSKIGGEITALGYGITSPTASDSGVRRIRQNINIVCVPGDESRACTGTYARMLDSDREFITEGYVCHGDSGGGAFDQASFATGKPYVLGALSRGPQTDAQCLAAIYSRTDAHAELIIAAGKKAAKAGGYDEPEWLTAPAPSSDDPQLGTVCEGDICTSTDATQPGDSAATTTTTSTGCSMASRPSSSFGLVALAGVAVIVARRRRR